jgi:hypothetical protein
MSLTTTKLSEARFRLDNIRCSLRYRVQCTRQMATDLIRPDTGINNPHVARPIDFQLWIYYSAKFS